MDKLVEKYNINAPEGAKGLWHSSWDNWCWLELRGAAVRNSVSGIFIGCAAAFAILLILTGNMYISLISIFCILSIIFQVAGMIKWMGWKFGIPESTSTICFVGLAVDYVIHLGHQYTHEISNDKYERTKLAFKQMGETIMGGALTSVVSGSFLVMCEAGSLNRFGILFLTLIFSSMITALFLLPSILYVMGPEGDSGNIKNWIKQIKARTKTLPSSTRDVELQQKKIKDLEN